MAFPKLREFMSEVEKFLDTDIKPFHLSSILPRGARRELDNAVPMTAGFRPSRVYYMFAVLNFAELGSWDEVKIHGPQALKEYHQFMREIPMDERDKPPTPLPPTDNVIMQDFSVNGSARFHTSNENMQYYSPRGSEENTRAPSRPSQRRSRDTSGHGETARETSRPPQRQTANASGYGENGRAPSTGRPSHGRSHDSSKRSSAAALQENHNGEVLKNDIVNSISKLRNEIGSLKDRLSQELSHSPDVDNVTPVHPSPLELKSPRTARVDDVTDKLAEAFSDLYQRQWLAALKERNNGRGHSEKNLIYLADVTQKCQHYLEDVCEREFNHMCEIILKPMGEVDSQYVHIPDDLRQSVRTRSRQIQRETMPISLPVIKEVVIRDKISEAQKNPDLKKFVERCVELLWMFAIHDPPLQLEWARVGDLVGSHLKSYTDTGNRVGFNVWPTLRQFRNGPVLCKGVVQPMY
ncbi:uncharacterized protein LOC125682473 isoform X2 [Ostrea edulis]|nr:uncharacterized protein LOC125682473 isoform X2 [Ostrea edulis]XP_048779050.2 uncharacterized protein LOC125682473 isoform X2 [Ostrea edulis]XP_048779051.2 uncharacterized protein LOC125682473 isoform X2 [Ostrea edulis]